MSYKAEALRYGVRPAVLGRYVGRLMLVVAVLAAVPMAVAWFDGESGVGVRYLVVQAGLVGVGLLLSRLPKPEDVRTNEGLTLTALMFFLVPLVMAYPLAGAGISYVDAFFEAVSGATTTGLTTLPTVEDKPFAFLFARAWMQWYGGLGIVIFSLALITRPGPTAMRLAAAEDKGDDLVGGTRAHARRVLKIYAALTLCSVALIWIAGSGAADALLYGLAAVSTGGFAPYDDSLLSLPGLPSRLAVLLSCLAGSLPLVIYSNGLRSCCRVGLHTMQLGLLLGLGFVSSYLLGMIWMILPGASLPDVLANAPLTAFSAQTTAGFSSVNLAEAGDITKALLLFPMLIGGGVGSTAGGFKVLRLFMLFIVIQHLVRSACLARHAVHYPTLAGEKLHDGELREAMMIILLYVMVVAGSWLLFVAWGYPALDALFEVASAVGTVGLSVGVSSPELPVLLKGVLCADMLLGRLEIVAWLVLFYPKNWTARRF